MKRLYPFGKSCFQLVKKIKYFCTTTWTDAAIYPSLFTEEIEIIALIPLKLFSSAFNFTFIDDDIEKRFHFLLSCCDELVPMYDLILLDSDKHVTEDDLVPNASLLCQNKTKTKLSCKSTQAERGNETWILAWCRLKLWCKCRLINSLRHPLVKNLGCFMWFREWRTFQHIVQHSRW